MPSRGPNSERRSGQDRRRPLYQDNPEIRKDWNHPSPEEIAQSLNHAHEVNRTIISWFKKLGVALILDTLCHIFDKLPEFLRTILCHVK